MRAISLGIVTFSADTHSILSANPAAESLFGRPEAALLGLPIDSLLAPDETGRSGIASLLRNGHGVLRLRHPGDVPVMRNVSVTQTEPGPGQVFVAVLQNISDSALGENEIREATLHYENLATNVPGVVYQRVLHGDGSVSYPYVSSGAFDIFGYTAEEIMADGSVLRSTLFDEERDEYAAGIAESAETLNSWNWVGRAKRKDGEVRWAQVSARPRRLENGDTLWDGLILDITERMLAAEELRQSEKELQHYHLRLEKELSTAREMQEALMPATKSIREAESVYGCSLQSYFETSSEIGGDFWGIQPLDESRLAVFAADFTGHGVGAAVNTFRLHALMADIPPAELMPAAYLSTLNAQLSGLIPIGQFATMIYAIVDTATDVLTYAAAGAPSPIFGMAGNDELIVGEASGIPLGISDKATYSDICIRFPLGAFFFLFSDALFESPCLTGDPLEMEGVIDLVERHRLAAGITPLYGILQEFKSRTPITLPDDLTTIWLARNSDPAG